ncbi:phosphotransferase [Lederbergia sp. NSJ-179]|uniref:phosphotransferase enzyme family protein n=1 Tax=Lederbergia sp. NSJ-179 TaxID=2931402 RepID=UPI001FCFA5C5|nr:phosphotransferase [Lederbergia sp. NSJ-179]MCJ7841968.1 phosphotransferase [Lederbergia sp. NSJ-179]
MNCFIEELWGLKNVTAIRDIKAKGNRIVKIINSEEGRFVLKAFDPSLSEQQIKHYTSVLSYLGANEHRVSPNILKTIDGKLYKRHNSRYMYMMEYVYGDHLQENSEDEYALGQLSSLLHKIHDFPIKSGLNVEERIENMYRRFHNYPFKKEYDQIIKSLPNFNSLRQSFIHSDIGPHNAIRTYEGNVVFIDLDDAGNGSTFIDIGYPLITQFIRYKDSGELAFNVENARAFYKGYFSRMEMSIKEKEYIFDGAVFMQLMYMPSYGENAVEAMWKILKYSLDNQDKILSVLF